MPVTSTLFGYKTTDPAGAFRRVWVPTHNADDMLLPSEDYVPAATDEEGRQRLEERYPFPEGAEFNRFTRVLAADHQFQTFQYPLFRGNQHNADEFTEAMHELFGTYGGMVLASSDVAYAIRETTAFYESDFVIARHADTGLDYLRRDTKMAKARRTRATGTSDKRKKAQAAAQEKQRIAQEKFQKKELLEKGLYVPCLQAASAIWKAIPDLSFENLDPVNALHCFVDHDYYWLDGNTRTCHDPLAGFFQLIAFAERYARKKGFWRDLPAVVRFLRAGVNPGITQYLGVADIDKYANNRRKCPTDAVARFLVLARRQQRRLRRLQRAEVAAV